MSIAETFDAPVLAGPKIPEKPLSFLKSIRAARENQMAAFPMAAYQQPIYISKSIFGTAYFINDPAGLKHVLLDNVANYPKTEMERAALGAAFGDGILVSVGEKWKSHRRTMAPSFDFKSIVSYSPAMVERSLAQVEAWQRKGSGSVVDIAEEMTHLTLEIISRTMFSADAEKLGLIVDSAMRRAQELLDFGILDILPLVGPWHMKRRLDRVRASFNDMDRIMRGLIEARTKAPGDGPKDLLDRLVAARDSETGIGMTDDEIRDELVIIFLAGHETTALAMTYVWYLLSQHPAAEAKLHAELETVLGGRAPTHADLASLPYTRMVIEESMRLYPPAPGLSARNAVEADVIAGQPVAKGATIVVFPWVVHRHRALWDNPERFDPERFSPERSAGRPRFAYMPFGGGPRVCIGAALAMTEASLILATMAQRFRLKLVPGQDIRLQHRITMRPRDGIKMILSPRRV